MQHPRQRTLYAFCDNGVPHVHALTRRASSSKRNVLLVAVNQGERAHRSKRFPKRVRFHANILSTSTGRFQKPKFVMRSEQRLKQRYLLGGCPSTSSTHLENRLKVSISLEVVLRFPSTAGMCGFEVQYIGHARNNCHNEKLRQRWTFWLSSASGMGGHVRGTRTCIIGGDIIC